MGEIAKVEKFTPSELTTLREELIRSSIDSWQAADLVASFLTEHGYGVNSSAVRHAVPSLSIPFGSHEAMQSILETLAYVM